MLACRKCQLLLQPTKANQARYSPEAAEQQGCVDHEQAAKVLREVVLQTGKGKTKQSNGRQAPVSSVGLVTCLVCPTLAASLPV